MRIENFLFDNRDTGRDGTQRDICPEALGFSGTGRDRLFITCPDCPDCPAQQIKASKLDNNNYKSDHC